VEIESEARGITNREILATKIFFERGNEERKKEGGKEAPFV